MGTDFRKEIGTTIDQRRDEYTKISDAIWGFAEPRFQEYESTKLQQEFLNARIGFPLPHSAINAVSSPARSALTENPLAFKNSC